MFTNILEEQWEIEVTGSSETYLTETTGLFLQDPAVITTVLSSEPLYFVMGLKVTFAQ
jgi:hypothetical protein